MELRTAFKNQYRNALAMMKQAVEICPPEVWVGGEHPRNFWRITYHALGYFHLYLYEDMERWNRWQHHRVEATYLDGDVEVIEPYTKAQILDFIELLEREIGPRIDSLELGMPNCGFAWYPEVSQVELMILSLRHFHGHLGQLHEILLGHGLDVEWIGQYKADSE